MHEPDDVAGPLIAAGAAQYLRKDQPIDEIVRAVLGNDGLA